MQLPICWLSHVLQLNKYPTCSESQYKFSTLILAQVITCFGGRFGIYCPSAFLKNWNYPGKTRAISKFPKITRVIYLKNRPNQTRDYESITPNQQTLCIETNSTTLITINRVIISFFAFFSSKRIRSLAKL